MHAVRLPILRNCRISRLHGTQQYGITVCSHLRLSASAILARYCKIGCGRHAAAARHLLPAFADVRCSKVRRPFTTQTAVKS